MPSRNSINRPKDKLIRNGHASAIGKKRHARSRLSAATRSSTSRYNTETSTAPRPSESTSLALYTGAEASQPTGVITNNTLSKKRTKKIERNQKYIERRNQQLNIDIAAKKESSMDIDQETIAKVKEASKLEKIKQALWSVVADGVSEGLSLGDGNGTTLGVQAF
ncbi:ribosome biogenesis protein Alb1p [[Candida] railenensis]|uniref:Ribosome biogenesis protein Alb1p n=1 Tax=[Candida] railenensis TaxID=45579 RepID=A0A9P0QL01_9ASCO|nr:ribosome biogenesis protein Alb1p [[Candida] railenensis]